MPTYNPAMQKAHLADIEADVHGLISKKTAELDGVAVTEVTFQAGAKWSNDLKTYAGTDLCELPHVALVITGTLRVVLSDGSQEDFSAGDVMLLPPGHDAWTVGDQACTFVEFRRATTTTCKEERFSRCSHFGKTTGGRDPLPEPDRPLSGTGGGCGYDTCSSCQVGEPLTAQ